jgi:hypothetical protein
VRIERDDEKISYDKMSSIHKGKTCLRFAEKPG